MILRSGEIIPYQVMIEEVVGGFLAKNIPCFDYETATEEEKLKGGLHRHDDFFKSDTDYELVIIKKRKSDG